MWLSLENIYEHLIYVLFRRIENTDVFKHDVFEKYLP